MIQSIIAIVGIIALILFLQWDRKHSLKLKKEIEEREKAEAERKQRENEELLAESRRLAALAELMIQAKVMGDTATYEAVKNMTYKGKLPEKRDDGAWTSVYDNMRVLKIAGMNYRGNLSAYMGQFKGVLVPEPKNEYDPFAIMVKVEDGKHVGYIKEEQTDMVRSMVGAEQLGFDEPVIFNPYRIDGIIYECEDEDGKKFYDGYVYLKNHG